MTTLTVRAITPQQHAAWVATRPSVSFLQLPEWGAVKSGWRSESLGWFLGSRLVGAGLVLYRPVPKVPGRVLAYLPEGPDIDWERREHPGRALEQWLSPLLAHCRSRGAFQVKMGPPVALRRWSADTVKAAMSSESAGDRIGSLAPDWTDDAALDVIHRLRAAGWTQTPASGAGFGDVQPR